MKRIWVSLVTAALLTMAAILPAAAQETVTIDMNEVDGSGQSGSADIISDGDQVVVSIEITPGPDGEPQPVHIHNGSCRDLGDVAYPLEDVVDGVSESTADVALLDLIRGGYSINVVSSEGDSETAVACGSLPHIGGGDSSDEAAAEEDDAEATDDEDATSADDEDAATDDEDATATDDDEGTIVDEGDDPAADDGDASEEDDAEDLLPATGGIGVDSESAVLLMALLGGATLGTGLLVRRRLATQS